jgi:hypothetical protein
MKKSPYFFEIKNLLIQFLAAFNNVVIKRFDENRDIKQTLQVRYVYAPKQRVIYDLVNFSQNITLPIVSVNITSFSRDENRVFNKNLGFYKPDTLKENQPTNLTRFYKTPVPVNIGISMNIMTKYQTDLDQIMSNFIPFCNPYIILSWKTPEEFNLPFIEEIRSEVLWSGQVNVEYPTDIDGNKKYFVIGNTNFTIKGWLFSDGNPVNNIFYIDAGLSVVKGNLHESRYFQLSSQVVPYENCHEYYNTEIISISANPQIENVDFEYSPISEE